MGEGDSRAAKLPRERVAYLAAAAPVLARLPAAVGYRISCFRGEVLFRCQGRKRAKQTRDLWRVLGGGLCAKASQIGCEAGPAVGEAILA